jgi:hypothetical protein
VETLSGRLHPTDDPALVIRWRKQRVEGSASAWVTLRMPGSRRSSKGKWLTEARTTTTYRPEEPIPRRDRVWQAAAGQEMPWIPLLSREDGTASKVPFVVLFLIETQGYRVPRTHVEAIRDLRVSGGCSSQRSWLGSVQLTRLFTMHFMRQATRWCW